MISPVNKYTEEELDEEAAFRARPQWFKFFYAAWLLSTAAMDDQQRGWYIQLLTYAASEGDIPGRLPDDEEECKLIAGFKELHPDVAFLLSQGVAVPQSALDHQKRGRVAKWSKVWRKFTPDHINPGYVFNRRLIVALDDAYRHSRQASIAGKVSVAKRQEAKALSTDVEHQLEQTATRGMPPPPVAATRGEEGYQLETKDLPTSVSTSIVSYSDLLENRDQSHHVLDNNKEFQLVSSNSIQDKEIRKRKKTWIDPEFRIDKEGHIRLFEVAITYFPWLTKEQLKEKLEQIRIEFIDYWLDRKRIDSELKMRKGQKANWYMAFRNRVKEIGYQEQIRRGVNNEHRYNTAADKRAENQRATDLYIAELQSAGGENNPEDPPGLSLTPDGS